MVTVISSTVAGVKMVENDEFLKHITVTPDIWEVFHIHKIICFLKRKKVLAH